MFVGLVALCAVSLPAKPAQASAYCGTILRPWDVVLPADRDCDGFPDQQSISPPRAGEDYSTTFPHVACAATSTISDEAALEIHDAWPTDFNDNQITNVGDYLKYNYVIADGSHPASESFNVPGYPYPVPGVRFDLNQSGVITPGDLGMFNFFMNKSCTGGTPSPPVATKSRYLSTVATGTLWNLGCAEAQAGRRGVVILSFGQPQLANPATGEFGTFLFDYQTTVTLTQIKNAALNYAYGYWNCRGGVSEPDLVLAVPTNNYAGSVSTVNYAHGAAWAQAVTAINNQLHLLNYDSVITAVGASDMETDVCCGWANATQTRQWIDGYASMATVPYYDYGNANGCPEEDFGSADVACQEASGTVYWRASDVWYKSWHNAWAWPIPEVYSRDGRLAAQWQAISVFAYYSGFSPIHFNGTLTQQAACLEVPESEGCSTHELDNPTAHGWSQLWVLLNSDARTYQALLGDIGHGYNWSTDKTWDN